MEATATKTEAKKSSWYVDIINETNGLAEEIGLDDLATTRLRDFIVTKAKDQYKAGNRSGIRWARTNPPKTA